HFPLSLRVHPVYLSAATGVVYMFHAFSLSRRTGAGEPPHSGTASKRGQPLYLDGLPPAAGPVEVHDLDGLGVPAVTDHLLELRLRHGGHRAAEVDPEAFRRRAVRRRRGRGRGSGTLYRGGLGARRDDGPDPRAVAGGVRLDHDLVDPADELGHVDLG